MEKIPSFPNVHHLNFEKNLTSSSKRKKTCFKLTSLTLIHNGKDCFEIETKKKRKNLYQLNLFNANPQWKRLLRDGLKRKNMNLTSSLLIRNGYDIIFQNFNREKLWG